MKKTLSLITTCILSTQLTYAQLPTIAADITTGSASSNPYALTPTSGKLYFQAGANNFTSVMDYSSGTGANVSTSGSYQTAYNRGPMSYFNNKLYFTGYVSGASASRLFVYNPSIGGSSTNLCDSIDAGFSRMIELGGNLYFFGNSNVVSKYGMYYVDASGSVHLAGYVPSSMVITYTNEMAVMNNKIYFSAQMTGTEDALFSFDPSSNTFATVNNPAVSTSNVRSMFVGDDNKLYYTDMSNSGREIFSYTGTGTPTQLTTLNGSNDGVNNPYDYASTPGYGHNVIKWGNKLYFSGCDGAHGYELMSYDLTTSTSSLIKDINSSTASSNPGYFVVYAGLLYFSADNGTNGRELWSTDGTSAGTVMIADTNPGSGGSSPWYMTVHSDGIMYFSANDASSGTELFKLDIPNGITQVRSVKQLSVYPNPAIDKCTISIEMNESQKISVNITDALGRIVATVSSPDQISHNVVLDFTNLVSGVYNYQVLGKNCSVLAAGKIAH